MRIAASMLLVLTLTACASAPMPDAPADADAALPAAVNDTCGASMYSELIGKPADGPGVPGESRLNRHIKPDSQVTADYVAQRMNIESDDKGVIRKINCG
jgi:hypothetical protein